MDAIKSNRSETAPWRPTARGNYKRPKEREIQLSHGSGGRAMHQLVEGLILPRLDNPLLAPLGDQAKIQVEGVPLAFTTDSFVVDPLFFAGGDIGSLSVHGTLNDLAVGGARPLFLSLSLIVEEGLPMDNLERVLESVRMAADAGGVSIVTGDTKVVNRGCADKLFINTAGVGIFVEGAPDGTPIRPADQVLLSGTLGDHGMAILSEREGFPVRLPHRERQQRPVDAGGGDDRGGAGSDPVDAGSHPRGVGHHTQRDHGERRGGNSVTGRRHSRQRVRTRCL